VKESENKLLNYYQNKVKKLASPAPKKKWQRSYKQKKSSVPVVIYGASSPKVEKKRYPASFSSPSSKKTFKKARTPASVGGMLPEVKVSPFEAELGRQYKKQMRHDQQVNELIDQLKSIDMDYKKDY
jgi:hypothetical protein